MENRSFKQNNDITILLCKDLGIFVSDLLLLLIDFFSALYLMAHFFATSIPASNVNFSQFGENKGNGFKRSKFYKQQNV